jgi:hypothetical protein
LLVLRFQILDTPGFDGNNFNGEELALLARGAVPETVNLAINMDDDSLRQLRPESERNKHAIDSMLFCVPQNVLTHAGAIENLKVCCMMLKFSLSLSLSLSLDSPPISLSLFLSLSLSLSLSFDSPPISLSFSLFLSVILFPFLSWSHELMTHAYARAHPISSVSLQAKYSVLTRLGYNPLLLVTRVDDFDPSIRNEPMNNATANKLCDQAASIFGVDRRRVFYLMSYMTEQARSFELDRLIYSVLDAAVQAGDQHDELRAAAL